MADKVAVQHDAEQTRAGLQEWFRRRGSADATVALLPGPQANGYSHETIVFELTGGGTTRALVARVEPEHRSIFPDPDLAAEYRLLDAIADTLVPLPGLHGFEPDADVLGAPFYVMDHIQGLVPGDSPPYTMDGWLHAASPEQREAVWWSGLEAMAATHTIDWRERDLGFVNAGREPGIEGELAYWESYIAFCGGMGSEPTRRAWAWLVAEAPRTDRIRLCWGDSRIGNQLFDGTRCAALLDWEMACIADPVQDLAWYVVFDELFSTALGVAPLEGIPARERSIARWEELTGLRADTAEYYRVYAVFRFALILQRLGSLQRELGLLPADSTFPTDNFVVDHLARICEEKGIT